MLKKEITKRNLTDNRKIRRKEKWSATTTDANLNTAYDIFKLKKIYSIINFNFFILIFNF
jgi:hypothetical protein